MKFYKIMVIAVCSIIFILGLGYALSTRNELKDSFNLRGNTASVSAVWQDCKGGII